MWKWSIWTGDVARSFILWSHNRLTTLWNHQIMWIILIRLAFAFHWHPYRKDHSTGTLLFLGNKTNQRDLPLTTHFFYTFYIELHLLEKWFRYGPCKCFRVSQLFILWSCLTWHVYALYCMIHHKTCICLPDTHIIYITAVVYAKGKRLYFCHEGRKEVKPPKQHFNYTPLRARLMKLVWVGYQLLLVIC